MRMSREGDHLELIVSPLANNCNAFRSGIDLTVSLKADDFGGLAADDERLPEALSQSKSRQHERGEL